MITRRDLLLTVSLGAAGSLGLGGYALAVEPLLRLVVTDYELTPSQWPADLSLKIAVLADIHAINPWMSAARIAAIARATNALEPDIILLAGDYEAGMPDFGIGSRVSMTECARSLSILKAPLGVHAVLGNHDVNTNGGRNVRRAFAAFGIPVMENAAVRLAKDGRPFWLLGLGDQCGSGGRTVSRTGLDDLPGTLAQIVDDAPAILLAHEPDIFVDVPTRIALTISGHTHGGQVRIPGFGAVLVPSRFGRRFAYGHIVEHDRHLVVSAGLGTSGVPVRFGVPPEIVTIRLGAATGVA
jgi:predicted MPP superfamily phosphohydrolase